MAYFPNGTAGLDYEERYCARCVHNDPGKGCPVMLLHALHNYDECNKEDSFLHVLIPRCKDRLDNEQCRMFVERPPAQQTKPPHEREPPHCSTCGCGMQQEAVHPGCARGCYLNEQARRVRNNQELYADLLRKLERT